MYYLGGTVQYMLLLPSTVALLAKRYDLLQADAARKDVLDDTFKSRRLLMVVYTC
jgi:hypothetical protein